MDMYVCAAAGVDFVGLDFLDEGEFRYCVFMVDGICQYVSGEFGDAVEGFAVFAEFHVARAASGRAVDCSDMFQFMSVGFYDPYLVNPGGYS